MKRFVLILAMLALAGCGASEKSEPKRPKPERPKSEVPANVAAKYTSEQTRAYWRGYLWCERYRQLGMGPSDEVGGDFYHDTGDSDTFDEGAKGCDDGYARRAPAVNKPEGFRLDEEPNDFEEEE